MFIWCRNMDTKSRWPWQRTFPDVLNLHILFNPREYEQIFAVYSNISEAHRIWTLVESRASAEHINRPIVCQNGFGPNRTLGDTFQLPVLPTARYSVLMLTAGAASYILFPGWPLLFQIRLRRCTTPSMPCVRKLDLVSKRLAFRLGRNDQRYHLKRTFNVFSRIEPKKSPRVNMLIKMIGIVHWCYRFHSLRETSGNLYLL